MYISIIMIFSCAKVLDSIISTILSNLFSLDWLLDVLVRIQLYRNIMQKHFSPYICPVLSSPPLLLHSAQRDQLYANTVIDAILLSVPQIANQDIICTSLRREKSYTYSHTTDNLAVCHKVTMYVFGPGQKTRVV